MLVDRADGNGTLYESKIAECRVRMMANQPNCTTNEFGPDGEQLSVVYCSDASAAVDQFVQCRTPL